MASTSHTCRFAKYPHLFICAISGSRCRASAASHSTSTAIEHPFEQELSFLYGTTFTGPAQQPGHHSRNVRIFADGEVDRSPTGSGVSARAALHYARGELSLGASITIERILGSTMTVRAVEPVMFGRHAAIVPEVSGTAHITGRNELYLDPSDPQGAGFNFR
jgi:proline racemase